MAWAFDRAKGCGGLPTTTISVYSHVCLLMMRANCRKYTSVQSIMGATLMSCRDPRSGSGVGFGGAKLARSSRLASFSFVALRCEKQGAIGKYGYEEGSWG